MLLQGPPWSLTQILGTSLAMHCVLGLSWPIPNRCVSVNLENPSTPSDPVNINFGLIWFSCPLAEVLSRTTLPVMGIIYVIAVPNFHHDIIDMRVQHGVSNAHVDT